MILPSRALARCVLLVVSISIAHAGSVRADEKDGRLDIYFIDVEGGAATLFITPAGESLLVDSGNADLAGRDRDRILKVLRDVAGKKDLDHASVSHWHRDHFGNHAVLASLIPIRNFWDRGIPDQLSEDATFPETIAKYRAASQNKSKALRVGDKLPLQSGKTPLSIQVMTASGEVAPNSGEPNPFAGENQPQPDDPTDNAKSVTLLLSFGPFRFLTCGDLTWNVEAKLVTPNNPIGKVDLFMVTHHGLGRTRDGVLQSNNPVLVKVIDPRVTVMCNGPEKGGDPETQATLRQVKSLRAQFQLHRNIRLGADEQAPAENIANSGTTADCQGVYIKASVAPDGKTYTVQIGPDGKVHTFQTRA